MVIDVDQATVTIVCTIEIQSMATACIDMHRIVSVTLSGGYMNIKRLQLALYFINL